MLLSPGIETKETSLQTTVVNSATGRAAMVGKFRWGPAFEIAQIVSEVDLVDRFYTPDDKTSESFFSAANFLKYGNDLRLVRVVDSATAKNASALFNLVTMTITNGGSNYRPGDAIAIKHNTTTIATGVVSKIDQSGAITNYWIPNAAIVAKVRELGTYPALGDGWTIEATSAGGGNGATLTDPVLTPDSKIYFPNDNDSYDALSATVTAGTNFADICRSFDLPTLSARFPGEFASGIEVEIASYNSYIHAGGVPIVPSQPVGTVTMTQFPTGGQRTTNFRSILQFGPQTADQFAMIVRRGDEILETAVLSTKPGDRDIYGNNIYVNDYFANGSSKYISAITENWPTDFTGVLVLGGGLSGNSNTEAGMWINGWDMFADRHYIQVNLMIAGSVAGESKTTASTVQKHVSDIATERQDTVAFISPPREFMVNVPASTAIDSLLDWRRGQTQGGQPVDDNMNINTTYAFIDGNYKFQYDKYNDINRWVPLAADMAGLCARTDQVSQPWMSPAGFNRGQIQGVIKLAIDTRQAHRDRMYQDGINPVVSFAGHGVLLYGDKMATSEPSPFDRINVRRLFNLLKSSISNSAQYKLFELNDAFTQMSFRSEVSTYLDGIRSLGGMYDFRVICDGSNNTAGVIDRNEFVATILVKPARSINFITLNFVATSTGADFDELVGSV